jgi:uncharacterized membrane protein YgdD (TMEM256/DUF423 family)
MLYDDDDPLLQLDDEECHGDNEDDVLLLAEEEEAEHHMSRPPPSEGCGLTTKLQGVIYHLVAKPVIRVRWVILGVYCAVLVVSIGLMTQLHPATKPPQLFRSDTNLQMLMDLAANFSDSGITCDECSAFYKETPVKPVVTTPTTPRPTTTTTQATTLSTTTQSTTPTSTTLSPTTQATEDSGVVPDQTIGEEPRPTSTPSTVTIDVHGEEPPGRTVPPPVGASSPTSTTTTAKPETPPVFTQPPRMSLPDPSSVGDDYNPCAGGKCDHAKERPSLELGAVVYVVFGIKDIDRSNVSYNHVLTDKGQVVYDPAFQSHFRISVSTDLSTLSIRDLCRVCKVIANNTKLVKPNSSQCLPQYGLATEIRKQLNSYPECRDLPQNKISVNGRSMPARAIVSATDTGIQWLAFAFESTTYKGQSYFTAYKEYQQWETFMDHIRENVLPANSPLKSVYQTSDFWENVMMEIVAVSSAIYGLVLSMIICITAVAIFTGHIALLLIIVSTIVGVICLVVGVFFVAGWEMGAVEAVSLSILVGSSVDYCVHIVEGYLIAGQNPPEAISKDPGSLRRWRTLVATSHIGVSITSSAVTTIVAAIPLTMTTIEPFSKFGQIVTINTTVSIFYTLTACVAFLSLAAPPRYVNSLRSTSIALLGTVIFVATLVLALYIVSRCGIDIPAPNGENLFPK